MSYGAQILNSAGETVFDSEHFVELATASFTVVGTDYNTTASGTGLVSIPTRCFVDDVNIFTTPGRSFNLKSISSGSYQNVYQLAVKANTTSFTYEGTTYVNGSNPFTGDRIVTATSSTIGEVTAVSAIIDRTGPSGSGGNYTQSDYTNAYYLVTIGTTNVSSYRSSSAQIYSQTKTSYVGVPHVWVRPLSSSYSGDFGLQMYSGNKISIVDYTNANNTFEVIVTNSAQEFGGIAGTSKYLAGGITYGVKALTAADQKYTTSHPFEQHTTYDSGSYVVQILLAKALDHGPTNNGTSYSYSLGSLTTSSIKRWCRMDSTQYYANNTADSTYPRDIKKMVYQWASNNSIQVKWRVAYQDSTGNSVFDNYTTKQPFAIAEFGAGV